MIQVIAFDGLNRCGKGTQADLLQFHLLEMNVFSIVVRGDGSREGLGESQSDPKSLWWSTFRTRLNGLEGTSRWFDCWNEAACLLAHEFIHWKTVVVPAMMRTARYRHGVLLVDRSLISRIMVLRQANEYNGPDSLYTVGGLPQGINWENVLPDVLFNFHVPRRVLLSRLDQNDPKYQFRRSIIECHHSLHVSVSRSLPEPILARTIPLDGDRDPNDIHAEIFEAVMPSLQPMLAI